MIEDSEYPSAPRAEISARDAAAYIADILHQLARLAQTHGLLAASALLEAASEHARRGARLNGQGTDVA
jgi:hypothetical protein